MDNNESRDKNKRHKRYISLRKNFKYTTKIKHQNVESQNIDLNFCAYAFAYTYKIEKTDKWEASGFEQVDKIRGFVTNINNIYTMYNKTYNW